jgi:molybdate transport system ATP-binding protein
MLIENLISPSLEIDHFTAHKGEAWCLLGQNHSGIDQFIQLFSITDSSSFSGNIVLPTSPAIVSFSRQQEIFEEELKNDDTDFLDKIDPGTPARDFLDGHQDISALIDALGMRNILDSGYRLLSTGESRKLLILQALSRKSDLLLLENPYEGLDQKSCKELDNALVILAKHLPALLSSANNRCDIPAWCTHIAFFEDGKISHQGKKEDILPHLPETIEGREVPLLTAIEELPDQVQSNQELVFLENGFAAYGERTLFSHLQLKINQGQHTLITGPNGSGKSTLLQIITGDNSKCYNNNLRLFGKMRGSGESIWDIKRHMGIISSDLHRNYRVPGKALHVVVSGLFDSIGVYRHFNEQQQKKALWWLSLMGMSDKAGKTFRSLTYAEQRLVLIARALIKVPRLLLLDEPTQGLDEVNRDALLQFLAKVAQKNLSTIIYASHRQDEFHPFFQQHLELEKYC